MNDQNNTNLTNYVEKNEAVLVYFFSDHCAPCISLRPKVEQMINSSFPKMKLTFINAETNMEIAAKFQVFASPTIILFFDGKETKRFSKYISIAELEQNIQRYYDLIFDD